MYVCVLGQLANKEDVGGAISFCTYLRNIWQLYIRLFVHFPVAMEIYKLTKITMLYISIILTTTLFIISMYTYDCI